MDEHPTKSNAEVGGEDDGKCRSSASRHRFSLATLLLVPFVLSPLFLSVQWEATMRNRPEIGILLPEIAAGIYGTVLALYSFNRQRTSSRRIVALPFGWLLWRSARYGALFGLLFYVPATTLLILDRGQAANLDLGHLAGYAMSWLLFLMIFVVVAALSGAAGGGLVALHLDLPRRAKSLEHSASAEKGADARALMQLPNFESAIVSQEKIVGYLLSSTHPQGAPKARFFSSCGFTPDGWEILAGELRRLPANWPVTESMESKHGAKYIIDGRIDTPSGQTVSVRTIWIIDRGRQSPRLVTSYPHDEGA